MHVVNFPNTVAVPTQTLVVNTNYRFKATIKKNGLPWNLDGASVRIYFKRDDGSTDNYAMTAEDADGGVMLYDSETDDLEEAGLMTVAFQVTDGGVVSRSIPFTYNVIASP